MKVITKMVKDHGLLILCIGAFFLLLIILPHLPKMLSLEARWIGVAAVPLLVVLIAGGYIKKFKGFGVELEARLKDPVRKLDLIAAHAAKQLPEKEKESPEYLDNLSEGQRYVVERLSFVLKKRDYYRKDDVKRYLDKLPRLKYLEVKKGHNGKFDCLVPVDILMNEDGSPNDEEIQKFLRALESGELRQDTLEKAIQESVRDNESLIKVLPKVRDSAHGVLAVVDTRSRCTGLVDVEGVEQTILENVLAANEGA